MSVLVLGWGLRYMKNEELISIIIPIYKVEKYLDRCIQSIVNQTYQNLEIILVDDGSPDKCPCICDEWAKKDLRIKVIHQKNEGVSAARNAGIGISKGSYIGFVDSDDYIEIDMYEKLYNAIKAEAAELAICSCDIVSEDGQLIEDNSPIKDEIFTGKLGLKKMVQHGGWYYVVVWNKLYSRNIVNEIKFPIGKIYEDEVFSHEVFWKCSKIVSIKQNLYKYVQRPESIMSSQNSIRSLDAIEVFCDRVSFYKKNGLDEYINEFLPVLKNTYINKRRLLFGKFQWKNKKRTREIDRLFYDVYFSNKKNVSAKEKVIFYFPTILFLYLKMTDGRKVK